jgi:hypothetical protein
MKSGLIRSQHVYLKLAIFVIGISSGFEVSQRQLAAQALLLCVYMFADTGLYGSFLFALRKLLTWFAAYWVFALIFGIEFPVSLMFTLKIIYLALITVAVWASVDRTRLWADLYPLVKYRPLRAFLSYSLATYLFLKEYLALYKSKTLPAEISGILDRAVSAGKEMHENSYRIEDKVEDLLRKTPVQQPLCHAANLYGLLFLCLLGIVNSL